MWTFPFILQIDILHPLATLEWKEYCGLPIPTRDHNCVLLNNKLYVDDGDRSAPDLKLSSTDFNSWTRLTTPTSLYALTTYRSQLVLLGGVDSNMVWTLDADNNWQPSLPPMPTAKNRFTAVNTGSPGVPECIVVAGGRKLGHGILRTVEVMVNEQWSTVQPLPIAGRLKKSTIHNGKLYLMGSLSSGYTCCCCDIKSLIDSAMHPDANLLPLWSLSDKAPLQFSCSVS